MLQPRDRVWLLTGALALVLAFPTDAWAYVDPGTGSYIFQLTAAGILAAIYSFRRFWDTLRARVTRRSSAPDAGDARTGDGRP